jgi:hypothetical protein
MAGEVNDAQGEDVEDAETPAEDADTHGQFPFRSGPRHLAGVLAFVLVIIFAAIATGHVPTVLLAGFVLWLAAVLITRIIGR